MVTLNNLTRISDFRPPVPAMRRILHVVRHFVKERLTICDEAATRIVQIVIHGRR